MHSAPSVSYPMGPSRVAGRCLWGLWCLGAAHAVAATLAGHPTGWRTLVLVFSVLLASAALCLSLRHMRGMGALNEGSLHFDGQGWSLSSGAAAACEGRVELCLDLQSWMLLNLREPGRPLRWLWLERAARPQQWNALRRAVYSRAPAAGRDAFAAELPKFGPSSSLP